MIKRKLVNVRLSLSMIEAIREASVKLDITISQFIRDALKEKLSRQENE